MTIAGDIAKYVHSVDYGDLSKETIHSAKVRIIDTFGCGIGALKETPVVIARKVSEGVDSAKPATILGTTRKTLVPLAAFANGTASRFFDFNDTYNWKEFAHQSDNIFPILAVAEAWGKSGREALLAIVLAYEIQSRLADAASLWTHGWDHVIYITVSVSAAVSKLLGLSVEETTQAINIALSSHVTMRQVRTGEISMWKAPAPANSARNAIFAVMLAKNGMTGPSPIFEGGSGLWNLVTGKFALDTKKFGNSKNRFKINDTVIKYFPAETRALTAIFSALDARKRFGSIGEIKEVIVETNEAGYRILGMEPEKWLPKTKETADHSMPFIVAAALMDQDIYLDTFTEERFRDKKILEFMKKIKVVENKHYTALFNRGGTVDAGGVVVKLKDGKKIHVEQIYERGHPMNPMSDAEIEKKFRRLVSRFLEGQRLDYLLETLWRFEKVKDIGRIFQICAVL